MSLVSDGGSESAQLVCVLPAASDGSLPYLRVQTIPYAEQAAVGSGRTQSCIHGSQL